MYEFKKSLFINRKLDLIIGIKAFWYTNKIRGKSHRTRRI